MHIYTSLYIANRGARNVRAFKRRLTHSEVVLGIIGPDTDESNYVLFELGASWGLGLFPHSRFW